MSHVRDHDERGERPHDGTKRSPSESDPPRQIPNALIIKSLPGVGKERGLVPAAGDLREKIDSPPQKGQDFEARKRHASGRRREGNTINLEREGMLSRRGGGHMTRDVTANRRPQKVNCDEKTLKVKGSLKS